MPDMSVTLVTSHFEMSAVSKVIKKILTIVVIFDTSQSPIGPCRNLVQLPSEDNTRQA